MEKRIGSIKIDTESGQLFSLSNNQETEIKCPHDVKKAYEILCTFEYLKDNFYNNDEQLWRIASYAREIMQDADYPIDEIDAINKACIKLDILLDEVRQN